MSSPRIPTEADHQAAFARLHSTDWPPTLHELRMAAARLKLVEGMARQLANGGRLAPRADLTGPITNARPARATGPAEPQRWPFPAKRPLAHALDLKRAAAGDRDD